MLRFVFTNPCYFQGVRRRQESRRSHMPPFGGTESPRPRSRSLGTSDSGIRQRLQRGGVDELAHRRAAYGRPSLSRKWRRVHSRRDLRTFRVRIRAWKEFLVCVVTECKRVFTESKRMVSISYSCLWELQLSFSFFPFLINLFSPFLTSSSSSSSLYNNLILL